ncbi:diacylglycerol/lipid kinase family protein [Paenibacillus endoradicis]|uniref:diacylglycerol/lipid kinase family protein n=1 Tax=Paenibacillus endoradicis TaxID=2972487 RepID=UPI002158BDEA|nr:diacylglycerol kinase family protein [Paenibacillus endoradicis]MCR8657103.1 diacylglycerol kinase family lipid kinase [Paenibacillus endoradicis]
MKVIFIVNEQAGGGKGAYVWDKIKSQLTIPYIAHISDYSGHVVHLAKQYTMEKEVEILLLAVGGDGTIHEVIEGAAGNVHIQIGAMKAGSGNDFARGYHIFKQVSDVENYYYHHSSKPRAMDLGQITLEGQSAHSFVNNSGIGFDAYITTTLNQSKLKRWLNYVKLGRLSYMLLTIWALFTFKRFDAVVHIGEQTHRFRNVWFISICNGPYFGGGMKISPSSKSDDQLLELTVVHDLSRMKLLLVFMTVFWGKHVNFREVEMLQAERFSLKVDSPTVSHVDGEFLGNVSPDKTINCQLDSRKWYLAK